MNYEYIIQEKKRIRVILDTDAACEADDQYAIVHQTATILKEKSTARQYSF